MQEKPLSPHLQIYKPQLTSVLSIMHRISGVSLIAGLFLLLWWLYGLSQGGEAYIYLMVFMSSFLGYILKLALIVSVTFHLINGIRHISWDLGFGLDIKIDYYSGWGVVLVTAIASLLLWVTLL